MPNKRFTTFFTLMIFTLSFLFLIVCSEARENPHFYVSGKRIDLSIEPGRIILITEKTSSLFKKELIDLPGFSEPCLTIHNDVQTLRIFENSLESPDMILEGYFQSDKYFKDFESEIRKEFTFKEKPVGSIPRGSCSIHVRRGDYVKLKDYHPLCSLDYYKKAMTLIPSEKYLVFSDDPSWCEDAFDQENVEVVRGNSAEQDLQLMSLCDNHIIANSSFSWWGAWLNASSEKKVVAPSKWFGPSANLDFKDVYCKDWILV